MGITTWRPYPFYIVLGVLFRLFLGLALAAFPLPQSNNSADPNVREFTGRIGKYVELHRRVQGQSPALPTKADSQTIATHEASLSDFIRRARAQARQGDIFSPPIALYFAKLVGTELKGVAGAN